MERIVLDRVSGLPPCLRQEVKPDADIGMGVCLPDASTLFISNIESGVDRDALLKLARPFGHVIDYRLQSAIWQGATTRIAFLTFKTVEEAQRARNGLDNSCVGKSRIKVAFKRDPILNKPEANIVIGNLPPAFKKSDLESFCQLFGPIVSADFLPCQKREKHIGCVQFEDEKAANEAISALNGVAMGDFILKVGLFKPKHVKNTGQHELYVKNFPLGWNSKRIEDELAKQFGQLDHINKITVKEHHVPIQSQRFFAFVDFRTSQGAFAAINKFKGKYLSDDQDKSNQEPLYVTFARNEKKLATDFAEIAEKKKSKDILVFRYLRVGVTPEQLGEVCSNFGKIKSISCKETHPFFMERQEPMKIGFVKFVNNLEAQSALDNIASCGDAFLPLLHQQYQGNSEFVSFYQPKAARREAMRQINLHKVALFVPLRVKLPAISKRKQNKNEQKSQRNSHDESDERPAMRGRGIKPQRPLIVRRGHRGMGRGGGVPRGVNRGVPRGMNRGVPRGMNRGGRGSPFQHRSASNSSDDDAAFGAP